MNKKRRERLDIAHKLLGEASSILECIKDEEQNALDNIPENLQSGDKYNVMENAIDEIGDAIDSIDSAISSIENIL